MALLATVSGTVEGFSSGTGGRWVNHNKYFVLDPQFGASKCKSTN